MLGVALGLLAALGFGSSAVFARIGLQHMRATTGTMVSLLVGTAIIMALAFALHSGEIFSLSGAAFLWFLLSGAVNFPVARLLNYTSLSLVGVSRSTPIVGASPLFATLLAVTILGEAIGLKTLAGTIFIVMGLILILSQSHETGPNPYSDKTLFKSAQRRLFLGYAAALGAALSYGGVSIVASKIVNDYASPMVGAAFSLMFGTLIMGMMFPRHIGADLVVAPRRALLMLALAGFTSTLGVSFWYLAFHEAPVVLVAPLAGTHPLMAIVLTHIFLQRLERVTARTILGALLVAGGIVLIALGTN